jgi:hypothetical protein
LKAAISLDSKRMPGRSLARRYVPKQERGNEKKKDKHRPPACDHQLEAGAALFLIGKYGGQCPPYTKS